MHAIANGAPGKTADVNTETTLISIKSGELATKVSTPSLAPAVTYAVPDELKVTRLGYWMLFPEKTSFSLRTKLLLNVNPNLS